MDRLADIAVDNPFLDSVDKMNMTALHVLSCNPNSTLAMIRELASKCLDAALAQTKIHSFPVDLYLLTKMIVKNTHDEEKSELKNYDQRDRIRNLLLKGRRYAIHDLIKVDLQYDDNLWNILLSFQGTSINDELPREDVVTGLYPLMTAAVSKERKLEDVYKLAIANPLLFAKETKKRGLSVVSTDAIDSNKSGST